jgi:hypothetical protein
MKRSYHARCALTTVTGVFMLISMYVGSRTLGQVRILQEDPSTIFKDDTDPWSTMNSDMYYYNVPSDPDMEMMPQTEVQYTEDPPSVSPEDTDQTEMNNNVYYSAPLDPNMETMPQDAQYFIPEQNMEPLLPIPDYSQSPMNDSVSLQSGKEWQTDMGESKEPVFYQTTESVEMPNSLKVLPEQVEGAFPAENSSVLHNAPSDEQQSDEEGDSNVSYVSTTSCRCVYQGQYLCPTNRTYVTFIPLIWGSWVCASYYGYDPPAGAQCFGTDSGNRARAGAVACD